MRCAGSASGLAKNFATLVEIMGSYGEVQIPQKGPLEEGRVSAKPSLWAFFTATYDVARV